MTRWIVFDTEDLSRKMPTKKVVSQVCAKTWKGEVFHERGEGCVLKFKNWLVEKHGDSGEPLYCYAHNAEYDIGNLFWDSLDELQWRFVADGRTLVRSWFRGNLYFVDSLRFFPYRLAEVGEMFGLRKLEELEEDDPRYVRRDVDILHAAIDSLYGVARSFGVVEGVATPSALAAKIWKNLGGRNESCGIRSTEGWKSFQACYPGRVELFRRRAKGKLAHCDVNSLYPWALTQKFPCQLKQGGSLEEEGIVSCKVEVDECDLPPLPCRRLDGSIVYPFGRFSGYWTTFEIRAALFRGARILKLYDLWTSSRSSFPYRKFTSILYERRRQADEVWEARLLKLILNSFTGTLAASGEMQVTAEFDPEKKQTGKRFGSKILTSIKPTPPDHVNYAHAAYVLAYSRVRMMEFMEMVGINNLCYLSTDALFFELKNEFPFEVGDGLGEMKLEGLADSWEGIDKNIYQFGRKYVAKGVPKELAEKFIKGKKISFDRAVKFREAIQYYNVGNQRPLSTWKKEERKLSSFHKQKTLYRGKFYPREVNFTRTHERK